jgi:Flp pilus assembly protein TadD
MENVTSLQRSRFAPVVRERGARSTDRARRAPELRILTPIPLLAAVMLIPAGPACARETDRSGTTGVELRCKLTLPRGDRAYKLWRVELKRSSGEPLRQQVAAGGDTARFKDVPPSIYVLCVSGEKGKSRCESIDLNPPSTGATRTIHKSIEVPATAAHDDAHQVNARKLAVPGRARREMIRSEEAQLRGDSEESVEHLERAIEIFPDYTDALNNLGTHYHRKGDYDRALGYFTRVIAIDERFFPGWINLAGSLLALGRLEPALEANLKAIRLRPNDALVNCQTGTNYFYLRRYPEAKLFFEKAVTIDPSSANAPQLFLAHIAMAEQNPPVAARHIRSFLDLHPNSPRAAGLRRTLETLETKGPEAVRAANPEP